MIIQPLQPYDQTQKAEENGTAILLSFLACLLFRITFFIFPIMLYAGAVHSASFKSGEAAAPVSIEYRALPSQERPLAIVRRFNPLVVIRHPDQPEWINAERTHALHNADTLRTGEEGFAVVQFMDNSVARVRPNSLLIVNGEVLGPGNSSSRISIESGEMLLNVRGMNSSYEVATPSAVAAVRGTDFSTQVTPSGESFFTVFEGEIEITALTSGQVSTLRRGRRAFVDARGEEITFSDVSDQDMARQYAEYQDEEDDPEIKTLRMRFINEDGEVEIIEIQYYELDPDQ